MVPIQRMTCYEQNLNLLNTRIFFLKMIIVQVFITKVELISCVLFQIVEKYGDHKTQISQNINTVLQHQLGNARD